MKCDRYWIFANAFESWNFDWRAHAKHSRIPEESGNEVRAKFQSTSNKERLAGRPTEQQLIILSCAANEIAIVVERVLDETIKSLACRCQM